MSSRPSPFTSATIMRIAPTSIRTGISWSIPGQRTHRHQTKRAFNVPGKSTSGIPSTMTSATDTTTGCVHVATDQVRSSPITLPIGLVGMAIPVADRNDVRGHRHSGRCEQNARPHREST